MGNCYGNNHFLTNLTYNDIIGKTTMENSNLNISDDFKKEINQIRITKPLFLESFKSNPTQKINEIDTFDSPPCFYKNNENNKKDLSQEAIFSRKSSFKNEKRNFNSKKSVKFNNDGSFKSIFFFNNNPIENED